MADNSLSQADAETLLRMDKKPAQPGTFQFLDLGKHIEVPLMLRKPDNAWQVLQDFMTYCGVVEWPNIVRGLFS